VPATYLSGGARVFPSALRPTRDGPDVPFLHLCYASELADDAASSRDSILAQAKRNNERNGITGCIAFEGRRCVQIIEGPRPEVEALFERIRRDPRHSGVVELTRREVDALNFERWGMSRWQVADLYLLSESVAP
jgi:hypothetical protein